MKSKIFIIWGLFIILMGMVYLPVLGIEGVTLFTFVWGISFICVLVAGYIHYGSSGKWGAGWQFLLFFGISLLIHNLGHIYLEKIGIDFRVFYFLLISVVGFTIFNRVSILIGPFVLFIETFRYLLIWRMGGGTDGNLRELLLFGAAIIPLFILVNTFGMVRKRSIMQVYRSLLKNMDEGGNGRDNIRLLDVFSRGADGGRDEYLHAKIRKSGHKMEQYVHGVLTFLSQVIDTHSCLFFHLNKEKGELVLKHFVSVSPDLVKIRPIAVGEGVIGWVASGDLLTLHAKSSLECQGKLMYYRRELPIGSMMVVPVKNEESLEGVICIDSLEEGAFGPEVEKLLCMGGELVAFILRSIRSDILLLEEREKVKHLSESSKKLDGMLSLSEIYTSVPSLLKGLVSCDIAFIVGLDSGEVMKVMNATGVFADAMVGLEENTSHSLVNWVLNTVKKDIFLSEARNLLAEMPLFSMDEPRLEIKSVGIIPLIAKDRTLGAIVVGSRDAEMMGAVSQNLLKAFGLQVATSLDNAYMYQEMEETAITDGLTNIYNHRYFMERLESELARMKRTQEPLALLLMDIDHFKKCNDTHGHLMGDFILRELANILKNEIRDIDLVARYGGEEFVILLVNTGNTGALTFAERLRKKIGRKRFRNGNKTLKVTISIGIASVPENTSCLNELIDLADQALYEAKNSGRNQSCVSNKEQESVLV